MASQSQAEIKSVLDSIQQEYRDTLLAEEQADGASDDSMAAEANGTMLKADFIAVNLRHIPRENWGELKVSNISCFGEDAWDFRQMGNAENQRHAIIHWDKETSDGINFLSQQGRTRRQLIQALTFYYLPHNALLRSLTAYNTAVAQCSYLKNHLAEFFAQHSLYLSYSSETIRTINDIPKAEIQSWLKDETVNVHVRLACANWLKLWRELSLADLLPSEFKLFSDIVDDHLHSSLYKTVREAINPWQPINLDVFAELVKESINWVEKYQGDIIYATRKLMPGLGCATLNKLFKEGAFDWDAALDEIKQEHPSELWNIDDLLTRRKYVWGKKNLDALLKVIEAHPGWKEHPAQRRTDYFSLTSSVSAKLARKIAADLGIEFELVDKTGEKYYSLAALRYFSELAQRLQEACMVIILATLGLRVSELRALKVGCSWFDGEQYWIRFTVFKTSESSQGEETTLPIPKITHEAIEALTLLGAEARAAAGHDYLFIKLSGTNSGARLFDSYTRRLNAFGEAVGIEDYIHVHQFRKTLAMFIIYDDPANLELIRRLFSHKSLKMTLAYILQIPGISEEVKQAIVEQNKSVLSSLLTNLSQGTVGGKGGLRVKESLAKSEFFKGMLHDDGWGCVGQYIEELLHEGLMLLHRAPMGVICIKSPNIDQAAPCDGINERKIFRIHPNVDNCLPFDCKWAVFTEDSIPELRANIEFHRQWLSRPYISPEQKRWSSFVIEKCEVRLNELLSSGPVAPALTESTQQAVAGGRNV